MSVVDERRTELQNLLLPYRDPVSKARRAFFDKPSFALDGKQETEFRIKRAVADRYGIPFRSVVFTGSAQLGFSAYKDTAFIAGDSDLDVACIDSRIYQYFWTGILKVTRAFSDESQFIDPEHAARLKDAMLRRGMILLDFLPKSADRTKERAFFDELTLTYRDYFGRVSLAVYMNEEAFCWKQASALANVERSI